MSKTRTYHGAGKSLSIGNLCGVVVGATRMAEECSLLEMHPGKHPRSVRHCSYHFVIADGVVAMGGTGPLTGTLRHLGKTVLADDQVAGDAACARLMGFEPDRVIHIREGSRFLGNTTPASVNQVGEILTLPATPFKVVPEFRYLGAL